MKKNFFKQLTKTTAILCISINTLFLIFSMVLWLMVLLSLIFVPSFYFIICYVVLAFDVACVLEIFGYILLRKE